MCAIVDANVAHEVFSSDRPEAGVKFFNWIKTRGRLVVSGKLLEELNQTPARRWVRQALIAGLIRGVGESEVNVRTEELRNEGKCRSDDPHVLALAKISGARLLYSNDKDLHQDFKDKNLIDNPRGRVYSTLESKNFSVSHSRLLKKRDLCRIKQ